MAESDIKHTDDSSAEPIIVSAAFRKRKKFQFKLPNFKYKREILIAGFLGIGIITAIYVAYLERPAIQVGSYSINRHEYNSLLSQAKRQGVNKISAKLEIQNALAARSAADKLNIKYPTDKSALNRQTIINNKLSTTNTNSYQQLTAYPSLIARYVTLGTKGGYEVGYVNFPFARYIFGFAEDDKDKGDPKLYRNNDALHADITYAKQQAEIYRQAYMSKKQSIDSIVQSVRADKRLTYGQATNQSDVFIMQSNKTKDPLYASGNVVPQKLFDEIEKAQIGQPSEVLGELWANDESLNIPEIKHGEFMDAAYYFIVVQQKVSARSDLQSQYDKLVREYMK